MSHDKPFVFWTSSPALPGDTVLLYGTGLDGTSAIYITRAPDGPPTWPQSSLLSPERPLAPLQPSESSVKFILETTERGVFGLWIETPVARSDVVYLNRPDVWRCQGDAGVEASPGRWLRVFGHSLGWGRKPGSPATTVLLKGAEIFSISTHSDGYDVRVELPQTIPSGDYEVYVHNGYGEQFGWSKPLAIRVTEPKVWPATFFNVKDFGAKADGKTDDTKAIVAALEAARDSGGGIVYFPRGGYNLNATLTIYPRTVLRGERADLVHLFWRNPRINRLDGSDLRLMSWGDGNGVPTSDKKNLVIVGTDDNLLYIRIFDRDGKRTDEKRDVTNLPPAQAQAVLALKLQLLPGLFSHDALTDAEKALVLREVTSIVGGQTRLNEVIRGTNRFAIEDL